MEKFFRFKYKSKAYDIICAVLNNLFWGSIFSTLAWLLQGLIFDSYNDTEYLWILIVLVIAYMSIMMLVYFISHKGVTVTDNGITICYGVFQPTLSKNKYIINYNDIKSIVFTNEPLGQIGYCVSGGDYKSGYIKLVFTDREKAVNFTIENSEEFLNSVKKKM